MKVPASVMEAAYRPALKQRKYRHDAYTALDMFSGFGGLSQGIEQAGFDLIYAVNHKEYKVRIHEANHPTAEHWIADLVNEDLPSYHDVRDLPPVTLVAAGFSCTNHSGANSMKAYAEEASLFDMEDPDYEARVTRSERDRATANCLLAYAAKHHPLLIVGECTTEFQSWGKLVPGKRKVGDGSTYRWWLRQFELLGYEHKVVFLNSMFFGVSQSRDRGYWVFWKKQLPAPDLEHRPESWCRRCDKIVEAVWTWKTGIPPTGTVRYGKQYNYRCPSCRREVVPPCSPSLDVLDLADLGTRIGDKPLKRFEDKKTGEVIMSPLAPSTMLRAERCRRKFAEFPAVLMPAKAQRGSEKHLLQPMSTQTSQQETSLLSTGQAALAVDNYQGVPRSAQEALPTQCGSETMAVVSSGVIPYRKNTVPTMHSEAMPTVTSEQFPGLLTAAGTIKNNGSADEAKYRAHPVSEPLGTVTSNPGQSVLFSGWYKQNGSTGSETAPHPVTDPFGTITSRDTTGLLTAEWLETLATLSLEDCYFRMMKDSEIGRGCGFDVDWAGQKGTFKVWGKPRDRVDGYGNAVSPPVGYWVTSRMRAVLHGLGAAA